MKRKVILILDVNDNSDDPMKMWSAEEDYLCDAVGELNMVDCVEILIVPEDTDSMEINFADQFVLARQCTCLMQYKPVATKPTNKE